MGGTVGSFQVEMKLVLAHAAIAKTAHAAAINFIMWDIVVLLLRYVTIKRVHHQGASVL